MNFSSIIDSDLTLVAATMLQTLLQPIVSHVLSCVYLFFVAAIPELPDELPDYCCSDRLAVFMLSEMTLRRSN